MYMCIYIRIYICICICFYLYMYTRIQTHTHAHRTTHRCTPIYVSTCLFTLNVNSPKQKVLNRTASTKKVIGCISLSIELQIFCDMAPAVEY